MTHLPKRLLNELPQYAGEAPKYTAKELVLALLANSEERVTTKAMMIYVYEVNKTVMKRTYLYQMLYKLRKAGLATSIRLPGGASGFSITEEGRLLARPYIEVERHGTG